jgi:hypothetical protein
MRSESLRRHVQEHIIATDPDRQISIKYPIYRLKRKAPASDGPQIVTPGKVDQSYRSS